MTARQVNKLENNAEQETLLEKMINITAVLSLKKYATNNVVPYQHDIGKKLVVT